MKNDMSNINELVGTLIWPIVVLILIIIFMYLFRSQIGDFILRVRSVNRNGVHMDTGLTPQKDEEKATSILQHIEIEKTVMLNEVEEAIFKDLKSRSLDYKSDTTIVLVRNLA